MPRFIELRTRTLSATWTAMGVKTSMQGNGRCKGGTAAGGAATETHCQHTIGLMNVCN
jgi:hypothetical protein